jgi:RNA polymerase sigma-70 factor (ECF subfamily)
MSSLSDADLVRLVRGGHPEAFNEIVVRHQEKIYNVALRHVGNTTDAEDIAQQTFINAYKNLDRFRTESALATWLFRITFNLAVSMHRTRGRRHAVSIDDSPSREEPRHDVAAANGDPAHEASTRDLQERIHAALGLLDQESRRIVILREFEGFSYDEIAEILSVPIGTVRSKLHRARLILKEKLSGGVAREARP